MAEMAPTPATVDPGPEGDFAWKGLNWHKRRRSEGGGPSKSGRWESANVIGPDAHDHVILRITNPSGHAPHAAEFDSTRLGFGYGTYTVVVEGDLVRLDRDLVFGGMFTYDSTVASWKSHSEIDVNETSAWGRHGPVGTDNAYFRDNRRGAKLGRSIVVKTKPVPHTRIQTHQMVWEPGRITWRSWHGGGTSGTPFRTTVATHDVPKPAKEAICFNFWDFVRHSDARETEVILRDFSFVPGSTDSSDAFG